MIDDWRSALVWALVAADVFAWLLMSYYHCRIYFHRTPSAPWYAGGMLQVLTQPEYLTPTGQKLRRRLLMSLAGFVVIGVSACALAAVLGVNLRGMR